ncbi:MAG: hypothetical protein P1U87_03705 [Verrucomicrobiales bacterium]|nr:hypothetical protein [Verrucomicrobiales bacterium]
MSGLRCRRFSASPFPRGKTSGTFWVVGLLILTTAWSHAITLTGANGRKVEFAGIKDATPKGITVQMEPEGKLLGVPWSKLDLKALETENALIFAGYQLALKGETTAIDLGTYAPEGMKHAKGQPNTPVAPTRRWQGWEDTDIAGVKYLLQLPLGKPRGILLIAKGADGNSFRYLMGHQKGSGDWGPFQNKYQLALLTYEYGYMEVTKDVTKMDPFGYADKGSGENILKAINKFAIELKKPELVDIPIAIYGADRVGAALSYSFVQWKPERVMAAVAVKGAFYEAKPTEASAKVPMLFVWGQYSNMPEIWQTEATASKLFADNAGMPLNWTSAREYRGRAGLNPLVEHFAREYLKEMIELRIPDEVPDPPKEEPKPEGADDGKGKGKGSDKEEKEEPAKVEQPPMKEIDRSNGYVGVIISGETRKIEDPNAPVAEGETFILNLDLSRMWRDFSQDKFDPPRPPPAP